MARKRGAAGGVVDREGGKLGTAYGCCIGSCGLVHFIGGLGAAFLLVEYLDLSNVLIWGWVLVIAAVMGHWMKKSW